MKLPSSVISVSERMGIFPLPTMLRAGRAGYQPEEALVRTEKRYRIVGLVRVFSDFPFGFRVFAARLERNAARKLGRSGAERRDRSCTRGNRSAFAHLITLVI
jgi:hypothetical protein